jgi:hypothetical protein
MIKEWGNLSLTQEIVKQENEKNQQKGDSLINKFAEEIEKFKKIVIKLAKKKRISPRGPRSRQKSKTGSQNSSNYLTENGKNEEPNTLPNTFEKLLKQIFN